MNRSTFLRRAFGAAIVAPALTAIIAKGGVTNPPSKNISFPSDPFFFKPTFKKGEKVVYTGMTRGCLKAGQRCVVTGSFLQGNFYLESTLTNHRIQEHVYIEWDGNFIPSSIATNVYCSDLKRV